MDLVMRKLTRKPTGCIRKVNSVEKAEWRILFVG